MSQVSFKGHPNIQPINFWWSDGSGKQHHMRFGWWPLCWIGRIRVAEEKEFDSRKPREKFGSRKKKNTVQKELNQGYFSSKGCNFQRCNWDLFNDSLRGFYIILKYVLCKIYETTYWACGLQIDIMRWGDQRFFFVVPFWSQDENSWETGFSSDLVSTVTASFWNQDEIYIKIHQQLALCRWWQFTNNPSNKETIASTITNNKDMIWWCNIASPNNSINMHHLQLVDINHFEAEFSISWGRCPCSFCTFPLQKCPWITCHLFFWGGWSPIWREWKVSHHLAMATFGILSWYFSWVLSPSHLWSYTNQQVMLVDWIPIFGQHLKSFGWQIFFTNKKYSLVMS